MNLAELLLQAHRSRSASGMVLHRRWSATRGRSISRPRRFLPGEVTDLFAKTLAKFNMPARPFPMSEAEFRDADVAGNGS